MTVKWRGFMDLGFRFSSRLQKGPNRFKSDKSVDGTYDWTIDPKRILSNSLVSSKFNELQIRAQRSGTDRLI